MLGNLGFSEILLIAVIALLLFGPNKLPELGRSLGRTLHEFKKGTREILSDDETRPPERKDVTPSSSSAQEPEQPQTDPPVHRQDSRRLPD
ncbi:MULTISPECIES: twin-arginine translocase TatA/TatE family subunit [unclassified Paenibacillus]|uniref:twin-arginine translocase TatA/TatE family subunit n=1 Tax=unclassified Paenibacillus TaxID=185978 RepID=UPI001AE6328C|nr:MULTISPECIES: twin-arginine translocase TatA/TatE family subunit [unclassified Paenibacillus]MBP1157486.1 sec-independent protein translocase protein TatA [Paenibacillus sp. PvP091]MBP1171777.1 sec-independent protein translocase protein TatA [Paenibacillus sp. PvR098]MBP2438158.1 sec-independent protein translocase protein TatA [Paenibacillus sp. PvP052]